MSPLSAGARRTGGSAKTFRVAAVAAAMLLTAGLALPRLAQHLFWDDEANTALYGRNLLRFHRLTAWDGTNLVGYAYGGSLGEDLGAELRVAPLPSVIAALGLWLSGEETFDRATVGGRMLFVFIGIAAVGVLALWLRRHLGRRFAWWLPPLLLALSPPFLLYIRNCRYYAPGVLFTLLLWSIWAPGQRRQRPGDALWDRSMLWRCLAGMVAVLLLIATHYLNAAAALAVLPVLFLDRRYRQRRQYVLLTVLYSTAVVNGVVLLATGHNPFAAEYAGLIDAMFMPPLQPDRWVRFYTNFYWFLRDLGTHEFFPWLLVCVLALPWARVVGRGAKVESRESRVESRREKACSGRACPPCPLPDEGLGKNVEVEEKPTDCVGGVDRGGVSTAGHATHAVSELLHAADAESERSRRTDPRPTANTAGKPARYTPSSLVSRLSTLDSRLSSPARLRPLAVKGAVLVAMVVIYALVAAALTPPDMGKGPMAEIRYVVPLTAVSAAFGGLTLVLLWRLAPPLALSTLVLLVGSNLLHLGVLADRLDQLNPCWPPTLYRYLAELCTDYPAGNEALIQRLEQLPAGTVVRVWPTYMTYPPMFYVPNLHYCDQLTESKVIDPELRVELPDYLFTEFARPEVIFVPAPFLRETLDALAGQFGPEAYQVRDVLPEYWNYTAKAEIPTHFFWPPPADWKDFPGMTILVAKASPLLEHPALNADPNDAEAMYRMALTFLNAIRAKPGMKYLEAALRLNPDHVAANFEMGAVRRVRRELPQAIDCYRKVLSLDPSHVEARVNLGESYLELNMLTDARQEFEAALEINPNWAPAHYNLGNVALRERNGLSRAIQHYEAALRLDPNHARAHVNLGIALTEQGDFDGAAEHFREAIRIKPTLVEPHVNLGRLLAAQGDREAAAAEYQEALGLVPPKSPMADRIRRLLREVGGKGKSKDEGGRMKDEG